MAFSHATNQTQYFLRDGGDCSHACLCHLAVIGEKCYLGRITNVLFLEFAAIKNTSDILKVKMLTSHSSYRQNRKHGQQLFSSKIVEGEEKNRHERDYWKW